MKDRVDGLLVLDKPGGMTSRTALDRALRWFPRGTRMGHTGTLDPLATGVLVACLGQATRLADYVQRLGKTYRAAFVLGARSNTDDADGTIIGTPGAIAPTRAEIDAGLARFVGAIEQVPPAYSAAKVEGRRAYDLARGGQEVELRPRTVQVYGIDVLSYACPVLEVEVRCGKGTYIRAIARDLGERLGCGGYVAVLRRTSVGPFGVERGVSLEATAEEALAAVLPAEEALGELPAVTLGEAEVRRLRNGQSVRLPLGLKAGEVVVRDEGGRLFAVALADPGRGELRAVKVLG